MQRKTILTCAVTGNSTRRDQHPRLPITPAEIATAAIEAHRAGAAMVHLHARDPKTERGTMELSLFQEIVDRIRQAGSDVIINLSTGEGGRFLPGDPDPRVAGPGTTLVPGEQRVVHVEALQPEVCSLDLNTMNSGPNVVINTPKSVEAMARRIYAAGVIPELELFDTGDLQMAKSLMEKGVLRAPPMIQLVLGVRFGAPADPATLHYLVSQLPPDSIWGAFGIGRQEFPMLAQTWLLGGHVRVGLEDNVFISKGQLARDNAELVEKGVNIVEQLGGSIASVAEAREILAPAAAVSRATLGSTGDVQTLDRARGAR
ncbi:MAG: 3-keto-5-aminohexanoate cleavage protein [Pseudomonadota bacterium]